MSGHEKIRRTWRHTTLFGVVEIVAETKGGSHVCALWCNGRRLDLRSDAAVLARQIVEGAYDLALGWPLSRMCVPACLSDWDVGGHYDARAFAPAYAQRYGCDPRTLAA
jgi:hypothetical protein